VGGQCIGSWGINTVKTLKFGKGGVDDPLPHTFYGGAAPEEIVIKHLSPSLDTAYLFIVH